MFLAQRAVRSSYPYQKGYTFGGGAATTTINGIKFADDSLSNPASSLNTARTGAGAFNSLAKIYIGGGSDSGGNFLSDVDSFIIATEAVGNPSATLALARSGLAGVHSNVKGYWGGGLKSFTFSASDGSNEIDGLNFSDESAINPSATLAVARQSLASCSSAIKGYYLGGTVPTGFTTSNFYDEIDGIQFSDESAINPSAVLSVARHSVAGVSALGTNKGYCMGGRTSATPLVYSSEIDGINFQTEAAINPSATLADGAREAAGGVSSQLKGYCMGGGDGGGSAGKVDGILFSDESAINPSLTISAISAQVGAPC